MKEICQKARGNRVLLSDGAWGTLLQAQGLETGECPELWCRTRPEAVAAIPRAYVEAGADLVKTNSFGANRLKLRHFGLERRAAELSEAAAAISREAAGPARGVLGSMGPTGALLLAGDVTEEDLYEAFREQALALERGGADACLVETFAALDEAALAVRAAREHTRLEVICTFTFERTARGEYRTMMGVSPAQMAVAMTEAGAHAVGTNCGNGMERMAEIVREMRAAAPRAVLAVHANAGVPAVRDGIVSFPESPAETAKHGLDVVNAGARIVGGCCGTTPAHIRTLAQALDARGLRHEG